MLSTEQWDEAAAILWKAFEEKRQQPPLSVTFPEMDMTDAYRIQERFVAARIAAGHTIGGYKIGLTSKAMQELAGSAERVPHHEGDLNLDGRADVVARGERGAVLDEEKIQ